MFNHIIFGFGTLCALWFALTAWFWAYALNLIYSYPVGLVALICWFIIYREKKSRTKIIPITLLVGFVASMSVLAFFLLAN